MSGAPLLLLMTGDPMPAYDLNFMGGMPAGLTYTNSSVTRTYFGSDGLLKTAAANEPIFEYNPVTLALLGMRWEMEQRTNLALWNRDLTNAAWVKTNGTAAKNQAGLDGVTNSASSFTATAANATCLQSITSASAARVTSFYLKRLTGTGTVNITQDNGTTWTAVTLTSAWQRFQVTATAADPIIGIRVVTSGDVVALDFAQHETPASSASSPIPTTTASVTRQPDVLTASSISPWYNQSEGTIFVEGIVSDATVTQRGLFAFSDGTINERIGSYVGLSVSSFFCIDGGVSQADLTTMGTVTLNSVFRHVGAYKLNNFAGVLNAGTVRTDSSGTIATTNQLRFGGVTHTVANPFMGYARRFSYYNTRLPDGTIQGMSRV